MKKGKEIMLTDSMEGFQTLHKEVLRATEYCNATMKTIQLKSIKDSQKISIITV
jgi:hypothetical protein